MEIYIHQITVVLCLLNVVLNLSTIFFYIEKLKPLFLK